VLMSRGSRDLRSEHGVMLVLLALLLPLFLIIGSVVVSIGSWHTHGKHLQTKVDAAAFAGGVSWAFPCGTTIDANIEDFARQYVGAHTKADGSPYSTTTFNPQVGKVQGDQIHAVLNGPDYYDADTNPNPSEKSDPSNPSICSSRILDVKGTEQDSPLLWGWLPLAPDIKRKARIEIQESEAVTGLLPIAVRVPRPVSAAAIFFDETPGPSFGTILAARYMCEPTTPIPGVPTGLGGWTTLDVTNTQGPGGTSICPDWANVNVPATAGVAIALSYRRACAATGTGPCFNVPGTYTTVNQLCNQLTPGGVPLAECFYATGSSPAQTVRSGLQFIRGYSPGTGDNAPELESVWLDGASGTNCYAYFSAPVVNSCSAALHAQVDAGPATPANTEVRYKLVAGNTSDQDDDPPGACGNNFQPECELTSGTATVALDSQYARHAFAIQVRLRFITNPVSLGLPPECANDYNNNCRWFFTGAGRTQNDPTDAQIFNNPVQRSFMGDIDLSGPVKWLHLGADKDCNGEIDDGLGETGQAASVPAGNRCFFLDMGLQGAIAKDQDEYPIAFNISTTSQHQLLDCDPDIPQGQIDDAIAKGCGPLYTAHDFVQTPLCPSQGSFFDLPQPAPWQDWDPKTCVKTRPTAAGNQLQQGFNFRFFGDKNNPTCPPDVAGFQQGRNYWNDANNANDTVTVNGVTYDTTYTELGPVGKHDFAIPQGDKRLVTLFFTPYDSFGGSGQATYPVVGLGSFYITGYGRAGSIDDPCNGGNSSGIPGAGSLPPPDLNFGNNYFVWGHFVKDVVLNGSGTPSGVLCDPASLTPCIATLVE